MKKTKKDKKVAVLRQWHIVAKELQKFLGADSEVTVIVNEAEMSADIITGNPIKADALFDLLVNKPLEWEDGSMLTFKVNGNAKTYATTCEAKDYLRAFIDNKYFSHVEQDRHDAYVMWNPIPVQVAVNNI